MKKAGHASHEIEQSSVYRGFGIREGNGIIFVSSQGYIYPSGFLALVTGNARIDDLADIYRHFPLFVSCILPINSREDAVDASTAGYAAVPVRGASHLRVILWPAIPPVLSSLSTN
jgi:hypothetical protein